MAVAAAGGVWLPEKHEVVVVVVVAVAAAVAAPRLL